MEASPNPIKLNQTKSNLHEGRKRPVWRLSGQTLSNDKGKSNPNQVNPKRCAYVRLRFALAVAKEAGECQPSQTKSNQIKPNQTKSNLRAAGECPEIGHEVAKEDSGRQPGQT
jgi:hypothetical protein